jgi:hypothetical protein
MKKIILISVICAICTEAHSQWSLTGNAGTLSSNFIGTTDYKPLKIRTNNLVRMTVSNAGKVGIGITSPAHTLDVRGNTEKTGNFVNTATGVDNYGVYGSCNNTPYYGTGVRGEGGFIGVFGSASLPGDDTRIGLQGYGENGSVSNYGASVFGQGGTTAYGIYAAASGGSAANWAGYFDGNIFINGRVGIGTTPANTLDVTGDLFRTGHFVNTKTSADWTGLYGSCNNSPFWGYGVKGEAGYIAVAGYAILPGDGDRKGFQGLGENGSEDNFGADVNGTGGENAYGIRATASGGSISNWSGYFPGNVYATTYSTSDRKLKNNIKQLSDAMSIINRLKPSVYTYKTDEYKQMYLPEGLRYGLIADELQQVLPGLVKKAVQPAEYENRDKKNGKKLHDAVEFNALNYTEIIPILIGGMKEQQQMIEELKSEIRNLKSGQSETGQSEIRNAKPAMLFQNSPNPFNESTVIRYALSAEHSNGTIIIRDLSGNIVKSIAISNTGKGQVTVNSNELSHGTYTYTLEIAGESVDTKLMVITK